LYQTGDIINVRFKLNSGVVGNSLETVDIVESRSSEDVITFLYRFKKWYHGKQPVKNMFNN
jgi:hypothetical protein